MKTVAGCLQHLSWFSLDVSWRFSLRLPSSLASRLFLSFLFAYEAFPGTLSLVTWREQTDWKLHFRWRKAPRLRFPCRFLLMIVFLWVWPSWLHTLVSTGETSLHLWFPQEFHPERPQQEKEKDQWRRRRISRSRRGGSWGESAATLRSVRFCSSDPFALFVRGFGFICRQTRFWSQVGSPQNASASVSLFVSGGFWAFISLFVVRSFYCLVTW